MFVRVIVLALVFALSLAAEIKLFLVDGDALLVREYEVVEDRVRYFSTERSAWEEIPLEFIDLDKTRQTEERKQKRVESMRAESRVERQAERLARVELHNVPYEDGVYYWEGSSASSMRQAQIVIDNATSRTLLQMFSPIPIVPGKTELAIDETHAPFATTVTRPMFFVRDPTILSLRMVRVKSQQKKNRRIVQTIIKAPQTNQFIEQQEEIELFRQQLGPGVYKIWPVQPLEPGEYAIIDFTPGEQDLRAWDFGVTPSETEAAPAPE